MTPDKKSQLISIHKLVPWKKNPRNNKHAIKKVAKSIQRFGFSSPIIVRAQDMRIIAGHTRYEAAVYLDMEHVPCRLMQLDENEADALALADNRLSELATWNDDLLSEVLESLDDALDFDLGELGFTDAELDMLNILSVDESEEEDEISMSTRESPISKRGETYNLGGHLLICGDYQQYKPMKADALFFDPPFNENLRAPKEDYKYRFICTDGTNMKKSLEKHGAPDWVFVWDCMNTHYTQGNRPLRRAKYILFYGDIDRYNGTRALLPKKAQVRRRRTKNPKGQYRYRANPEGTQLADVFTQSISELHTNEDHKHSKPIEWLTCILGNFDPISIFDPTAGSGSSLISADMIGAKWRGIEIEPLYCDLIRRRWTQHARKYNKDIGDGL